MSLRDVLRIRDFRLLFTAQFVSDIGDGLTNLGLLLLINQLTGSTAALAAMAIALALPHATLGLVAGVYVDRFDRRRIMLISDLLRAALVLGFVLIRSADLVWLLYLLAFAQSTVGTFFTPARGALLPHVVPAQGLLAANSVSQVSRVIGSLIGAGAAGVMFGALGVAWPGFVLDSLTFLVSFLLVTGVSVSGRVASSGEEPSGVFQSLREGLGAIAASRVLLGTLCGAAVAMLGLGAVNVLFVPLLLNDLRVAATWFGAMEGAQTASMVLAGGVVGTLGARFRPTSIMTTCLAGTALIIALLAGVSSVGHVIVLLFLVGWLITPLQASVATIAQTQVVDALRGRVGAALNAVIQTTSILSMAFAGLLGEVVGIRNVFLIAGGVVAVAALASLVLFRGAATAKATRRQEPRTA
jgi:MFS family permease